MQCDGSKKIKYRWDRLTEVSPSKYQKCSKMCRQPPSCLVISQDDQEKPCELEGNPVSVSLGNETHVTLDSSVATSREWSGTKTNHQFSGMSSLGSAQKIGGGKDSGRKSDFLLQKNLFSKPSCQEKNSETVSLQSEALSNEMKYEGGVNGDSSLFPMPHTSSEGSSQKNCSMHEKRKRLSDQPPSALFRRTLLDTFGSSFKKRAGKEDANSSKSPECASPERTEAGKPSSKHARNVSSSEGEDQESKRDLESKNGTRREGDQCSATWTDTRCADTLAQSLNDGGAGALQTSRLVFLHEDSDEDDQKKAVVERDPSVGSDFSDVEDLEPLIKFSQDELLPSSWSEQDVACLPSDYIMYPSHLYRSPWCDYSRSWTSTPCTDGSKFKRSGSGSSYISENSVFEAVSSLSTSKNFDTAGEDGCYHSGSFDSWIHEEKRTFEEVELDTSYRAQMSDFLPDQFVQEQLPIERQRRPPEGFIDTHCHLDMLYAKLSFKGTFAKFRQEYDSTFPKEFQGCIADFCNPHTLKDFLWNDLLGEDLVWGAFGCHPHFARYYTEGQKRDLLYALRHPKAVAFGEMGLDYSHKCTTEVSKQHKVFEQQLQLGVALKKPLVIHCRDADKDLLEIMKKYVPRDYKIHRHALLVVIMS
ncbi:putative deoxyribonuclease TATDN2 isoform X2 [Rhinatrema bivittatum]|nr:putative deoxyribonuclease TATDN2 isoform X2 [Rhinatrema bivittatum]XP_029457294.1 putative deoxyribonuclease TATDN2 isoform X2 [Rhinatrema bivittatum]XP_029457295.1 putative deoxyribonuclease TATDN2 isoform X2 [Rhinatrema bivittatum]